jgi:hypothetical protein
MQREVKNTKVVKEEEKEEIRKLHFDSSSFRNIKKKVKKKECLTDRN